MKRIAFLLILAALLTLCAACGSSTDDASTAGEIISREESISAPAAPEAESGDESKSEPEAEWNDVHKASYDMYLRKYVVPYGNLKFYENDWTNAADLGAERIVEFALQKNFNFYSSPLDYGSLFGDEFTYMQVPEAWFDSAYGIVYPQDIIENTAIEYFGLDTSFLRSSKLYLPSKNGYTWETPISSTLPEATPEAIPNASSASEAPLPNAPKGDEGELPDVPQNGDDEAVSEPEVFIEGEREAPPAIPTPEQRAKLISELFPEVIKVRRKGTRAEITFTLTPCAVDGTPIEGPVRTRVMTVEDKTETFRYVSVVTA